MTLRAGENIRIVQDGEDTFIHAPLTNKTTMKQGVFLVQGDAVEVRGGEHIRVTSINPDVLVITVDIDKEKARIVDLERRVKNLEKVIADLLKGE